MRVLLTAFEPFGGETINPSIEVAHLLRDSPPPGMQLSLTVLPVTFGPDVEAAWPVWDSVQPDLVLALGQHGGAAELRLERYAHNLLQDRPDSGDPPPLETPILADGPPAYETPLPIALLAARLRDAGIPARVTRDAGIYVCNHFYYHALRRAAEDGQGTQVGFIHLPFLPEQAVRHAGYPSLSLELMITGVRRVLLSVAEEKAFGS